MGIGVQRGLHGFMPQPVRNLQWGKAHFDQHTGVGVPEEIQTFGFYSSQRGFAFNQHGIFGTGDWGAHGA